MDSRQLEVFYINDGKETDISCIPQEKFGKKLNKLPNLCVSRASVL